MLKVKEVAKLFSVSERTVWNWVRTNKIKSIKIGNVVRIPDEEIQKLKKTNKIIKTCPIKHAICDKENCMWWCEFAKDCSIPLLAGMFADSTVCRNVFEEEYGG